MKLRNAAKYFDDTDVADGYTGQYLWRCQFSSFNDANAVGSTSTRRVLSIAPGLEVPDRRVLKIFEDRWLVGDGNPDSFKNQVIRQSYNMRKVNADVEILTPGQACLGSVGTQSYAQCIYFKDTINSQNNADYDPFWNYFFAPTEPVEKGSFIRNGNRLLRARSEYTDLGDLRVVPSDEVDAGPLDAVFATGAYIPLSDSYAADTVTTQVLFLDFTKVYSYVTKASDRQAAGDMSAYVAASALTPTVDQTLLVNSINWTVLAAERESDAWLMHLRRA